MKLLPHLGGYIDIMTTRRIDILTPLLALLLTLLCGSSANAISFSQMSLSEVSALLGGSTAGTISGSPTSGRASTPVDAHDLLTKVYGLLDAKSASKTRCEALNAAPDSPQDSDILWLDSADGYSLSYRDMTPQLSSAARFDNDDSTPTEYCYFFLFPYAAAQKNAATREQAQFTGTLLQEIADSDADMGADSMTTDLLDAYGNYDGNFINIRLLDDQNFLPDPDTDRIASTEANTDGRYILMIIVEPSAFTEADDYAAL